MASNAEGACIYQLQKHQQPIKGTELLHTIERICECLSAVTKSSFSFLFISFFLKLTLEFSGCTWVYFQSIVQGVHCAVHRKHSSIHGAQTSRMLSESFSGIMFARTTSVQTKVYCSYNCTTAEMCEVSQSFVPISSVLTI